MQIRRKTMKNSTTQIASEIIKYPVRKNLMKELQAPPLHKNPENSAGDRRAPGRSEALSGLGAARKAPSARPVALQVRHSPRSPSRCSGRPRQRLLKRVHSRRTGLEDALLQVQGPVTKPRGRRGFPGAGAGRAGGPGSDWDRGSAEAALRGLRRARRFRRRRWEVRGWKTNEGSWPPLPRPRARRGNRMRVTASDRLAPQAPEPNPGASGTKPAATSSRP